MPGRARDTWIIFVEELRRLVRSKWYLISTIAVVVVLVAAVIVVPPLVVDEDGGAGADQDLARIGFVDEGGVGLTGGARSFDDVAQGLQAVARGDIDWLYVVPADYLQTGRVAQYGEFEGRFPSNPQGEAIFRALLSAGLLRGRVDPQVEARVLAPAEYESYRVGEDGTVSELTPTAEAVGEFMVPLMFAALLGLGLAAGAGTMVQSVSEEKESRLVEVVITSASPIAVMAGKLLALVAVGLAQAAVWIIATAVSVPLMFSRIPMLGEFSVSAQLWLIIAGSFITGYFLVTALALLVAAIAPSVREASGMGSWVSLVAFVPVWFSGFLMSQPDGIVSRVLTYVPFTAPSGILVRLSAGGDVAGWEIGAALAGVVVMGMIVLWIATRVFRMAILMRGQSFTRHNLWEALRNAA